MKNDENIPSDLKSNEINERIPSYSTPQNLEAISSNDNSVINIINNQSVEQNVVMPEFNNDVNTVSSNYVSDVAFQSVIQDSNPISMNEQNYNQVLYNTTNSINDKPVEKKQKKATIMINPELKTAIVLALILLIFILIMPSIFDLFY